MFTKKMMNRNFIFIFTLLVTFSLINAVPHQLLKRATQFEQCPLQGAATISVVMDPDPPVSEKPDTFTVTGTLSHDITAQQTILLIGYADPKSKEPVGDGYIQEFTESIKAGTSFTITAKDVATPKLPNPYFIGLAVGDPTDDPKTPLDVYGCTFAIVGGTTEEYPIAGLPIAGYPIA